jgi:hypothetical protein
MPQLKKILRNARLYAPDYNRGLHCELAKSRPFGSSLGRRLPRLLRIMRAKMEDPKTIIAVGSVPPPGRMAKIICPALYRNRKDSKPRKPCKAEPDVILTSSDKRTYLRLDNGQIVKAHIDRSTGNVHAFSSAQDILLRPADQAQLATQQLPRA